MQTDVETYVGGGRVAFVQDLAFVLIGRTHRIGPRALNVHTAGAFAPMLRHHAHLSLP